MSTQKQDRSAVKAAFRAELNEQFAKWNQEFTEQEVEEEIILADKHRFEYEHGLWDWWEQWGGLV